MDNCILKLNTDEPKIVLGRKHQYFLKPGSIPDTVRELIFDDTFESEIEPGVIPMGTQIVEIGRCYNKQIKPDVFPASVVCIKFGKSFDFSLEGVLPENLKSLYIANNNYSHSLEDVVPASVTDFHLAVSQTTRIIPKSVTHLYIFNGTHSPEYQFDIPDNLKYIYISRGTMLIAMDLSPFSIIDVISQKNYDFILSWELRDHIIIPKDYKSFHIMQEKFQDNYILSHSQTSGVLMKFRKNDIEQESFHKIINNIKTENAQLKQEIKNITLQNNDLRELLKQNNNICEKVKQITDFMTCMD